MDLQPKSSFVKFALDSGNSVFLVSWKNAGKNESHLLWDDYVERGIINSINVVLSVSNKRKVNTLGFCIGGTFGGNFCSSGRRKPCQQSNTYSQPF